MSTIVDFIVSVVTSALGGSYRSRTDNSNASVDIGVNNSQNTYNSINIDQSRTVITQNYYSSSASDSDTDLFDVFGTIFVAVIVPAFLLIRFQDIAFVLSWVLFAFIVLILISNLRSKRSTSRFVLWIILSVVVIAMTAYDIIAVFSSLPPKSYADMNYLGSHFEDAIIMLVGFVSLAFSWVVEIIYALKSYEQNKEINMSEACPLLSVACLVLSWFCSSGTLVSMIESASTPF